jgi:tetratricopeptide (TPR) repeat protein
VRAAVLAALVAASAAAAPALQDETFYGDRLIQGAFLSRVRGARPAGMGEAFSAIADDPAALMFNPAGAAGVKSLDVMAIYGGLGNGMGLSGAAVSVPAGSGVVGLSLAILDYGSYEKRDALGASNGSGSASDIGGQAAYALRAPRWLGGGQVGAAIELARDSAGDMLSGLSAGVIVPFSPHARGGAAVQHIGLGGAGTHLPALVRLGGGVDPVDGLTVAADGGYVIGAGDPWFAIGGEFSGLKTVVFRIGYKWSGAARGSDGITGITAGLGFREGAFQFDYAYQPFGDLATGHLVSVAYRMPTEADKKAAGIVTRDEAAYREDGTADGLVARGDILSTDGLYADALELYRQAIGKTGGTRETVAKARAGECTALWRLKRFAEMSKAGTALVNLCKAGRSGWSRSGLAKGMYYRAVSLQGLRRYDSALAAYDSMVRKFGTAKERDIRVTVIRVLIQKGAILEGKHRKKDAIAVYDSIIRRCGSDASLRPLSDRARARRSALAKR